MELVIVTGMSGAGKSQAVSALEDIGYYCVDNIPPRLITKFAELPGESGNRISKVALVIDVRSQELFFEYAHCLDELARQRIPYRTLFLDCSDGELFNRYKETRRRHPLHQEGQPAIEPAIARERKLLAAAKERADFVVDSSHTGAIELRARVREMFLDDARDSMTVVCSSFGFKNGIPSDADLLFDVRCLPNPFYVDELRPLTGLDKPVRDYVLGSRQAKGLIPKLLDLVDYLIPLYRHEGKSQLVVSIGCTGGKHRSVAFCELLAYDLAQKGIPAKALHRDINVKS
ncbi:MAG: RNase adapter RapZ [Oscillospiraceae bacterium]|nr:RNase adapter RapZ [Oscillospiraceae bacterium]